jgi:hypothetical protein
MADRAFLTEAVKATTNATGKSAGNPRMTALAASSLPSEDPKVKSQKVSGGAPGAV